MTYQQATGLYPFVTNLQFADPILYPDISLTTVFSDEPATPVITKSFDLYNVHVMSFSGSTIESLPLFTSDTSTGIVALYRYVRQDYQQNYYVSQPAVGRNGCDVSFYVYGSCAPYLYLDMPNNLLYFLFNSPDTCLNLAQYSVADANTPAWDLSLNWLVSVTEHYSRPDRNVRGLMLTSDTAYIYDLSYDQIALSSVDLETGFLQEDYQLLNLSTDQTGALYCQLFLETNGAQNLYYVLTGAETYNMSGKLLSDPTSTLVSDVTLVFPGSFPYVTAYTDMCSTIYGLYSDVNDVEQIAYNQAVYDLSNNLSLIEPAFLYNIDKYQQFGEEPNPNQQYLDVAGVTNIYNPNFVYFVYVSTTYDLRVVKLYRVPQTGNTYQLYTPIIMWATRLNSINLTPQQDYIYANPGGLVMFSDSTGLIYLMARDSDTGIMHFWRIDEWPLDLGQTVGDITAPPTTMPLVLQHITDNYTIYSDQIQWTVAGVPSVGAVFIQSMTQAPGTITLRFQYLNYNALQLYPSSLAQFSTLITYAFNTLYTGSSVNVINLGAGTILSGADTYIDVELNTSSLVKPCVVRGTEILRYNPDTGQPERCLIERLPNPEINEVQVYNQDGTLVRVLAHLRSTIRCTTHNAPYLIPANWFGRNRPYRDLLISGDHGILYSYKVGHSNSNRIVYPEELVDRGRGGLHQTCLGKIVEYHHLLLEHDERNFYVANGLEVDSYHKGIYIRAHRIPSQQYPLATANRIRTVRKTGTASQF